MGRIVESGRWLIGTRPHVTTISPDRDTVYSFDLEGRPISWYDHDRVFKRSLSSDLHVRERRAGRRRRRVLPRDDAALRFADVLARVRVAPVGRLDPESRERIDTILTWTPERLLAERERFDTAYRPVSILPPDQYLAIVLQATLGCSWNRCTFCSFFQDRRFHARTASQFKTHLEAVGDLLGRVQALRRRVFLADGNALILSNDRLRPMLRAARERFPGRALYGFVDVFTGERKSVGDWEELADLGLNRVYVGLETGHDPLLRWLNKPGDRDSAVGFVKTLKTGGLAVSPILMCGPGGERFADAHVADTIKMIASLPLDRGDLVYLSPFLVPRGTEYELRAREDGVQHMDHDARERQHAALRDGIRHAHPEVQVARYDIREFIY